MLKSILKLVAFLGFLVAVAWIFQEPKKYDPWIAALAALVVFLGLFLNETMQRRATQNQQIKEGSTGIQAGGNVSINIASSKDNA